MRKLLSVDIFSINPCYTPDLENIKINPLINQLFIQHKANTKLLIYFDQLVDRIYPIELQLNRANSSDTEAAFSDLNLCITNGTVSTKIYYKRDDFDFDIVNFQFLENFPISGWRYPLAYLIWGKHISNY